MPSRSRSSGTNHFALSGSPADAARLAEGRNTPQVAATKGGIEATTHILANEMRGKNITVNAIAPGPTATHLFLDGKPQQVIDHLAHMPPLERLGTAGDIAAALSFLAGPDGSWINGQVLRANGGIV